MAGTNVADVEAIGMKVIYENRWMRVREDVARRRDGSEGIYGVVEKPDFVVIVPVEGDGSLHLVQQFRYPVGGRHWEFPQDFWEAAPDVDSLVFVRRVLASAESVVISWFSADLLEGFACEPTRTEAVMTGAGCAIPVI